VDSPVGPAAWIYEKFAEWTDSDGNPEMVLSYTQLLDNIMMYWLPATGASSSRLYWEFVRAESNPFGYPAGTSHLACISRPQAFVAKPDLIAGTRSFAGFFRPDVSTGIGW
jgi:hypothetical protein